MKVFSLAVLILLLATLWTGSQGISFRSSYGKCCYKNMFVKKEIPAAFIKDYKKTPSHCPRRAMRVEVVERRNVCVDPEETWFQNFLQQESSGSTS
uniref:Chemokine interleukin-8-like domain-containing protein n=1 Tax=Falco tinnunculus TaxID=100819 RepID=A0A8C4XRJ3_FALTI